MSPFAFRLSDLLVLVLVLVLGAGLRFAHLGADPPLSLSRSNSEVMDGPWYLAAAADGARGRAADVPSQYRRPLFTAAARAAFEACGVSLETAHGLAAASGILLVLLGALAAHQAFGTRAGLLAGLFLASSFVLTGYGRTPLLQGPMAAGLAAVFWLHALGVRRHDAYHAAAWALLGALAWGLKETAVAIAPALLAGQIVAARSRGRAALGVALAGAAAALALVALRPDALDGLVAKARWYVAGGEGAGAPDALLLVKRIARAPMASGLSVLAPALLAAAWVGALVTGARRTAPEYASAPPRHPSSDPFPLPRGELPVSERRLERALDAAAVVWLLAAVLLHAPFAADPQEDPGPLRSVPLRHLAPALVPAAILAARGLALLAEGVEVHAPAPAAFAWGIAGGYVLVSTAWHGVWVFLGRPATPPSWFPPLTNFFGCLAQAAALGAVAAAWLGRGPRALRVGGRGAAAVAVIVVAAEAVHLVPLLARPTFSLREANAAVARALPPGASVEGSYAHALTYDADVDRHFRENPYRDFRVTHVICEAPTGERIERIVQAMEGRPLERVLEVTVRETKIRVYRYPWAGAGGTAAPGAVPMGPGSR